VQIIGGARNDPRRLVFVDVVVPVFVLFIHESSFIVVSRVVRCSDRRQFDGRVLPTAGSVVSLSVACLFASVHLFVIRSSMRPVGRSVFRAGGERAGVQRRRRRRREGRRQQPASRGNLSLLFLFLFVCLLFRRQRSIDFTNDLLLARFRIGCQQAQSKRQSVRNKISLSEFV
jgi:hypothetical protein